MEKTRKYENFSLLRKKTIIHLSIYTFAVTITMRETVTPTQSKNGHNDVICQRSNAKQNKIGPVIGQRAALKLKKKKNRTSKITKRVNKTKAK